MVSISQRALANQEYEQMLRSDRELEEGLRQANRTDTIESLIGDLYQMEEKNDDI